MKTKIIKNLLGALIFIFISCSSTPDSSKIASLAKSWVTSSYESKDAALKMVTENMSDDGYNVGARYVGIGFNYNSDVMEADGMIVTKIIKGSPASSVLEVGDKFIMVNELLVTKKSTEDGSLSFRGKPGVPVTATVLRANMNSTNFNGYTQYSTNIGVSAIFVNGAQTTLTLT